MKLIATWDYQVHGSQPTPVQNEWWKDQPELRKHEYSYRAEFYEDAIGRPLAVVFTYKKHPLTGKRYIERTIQCPGGCEETMTHTHGLAAVNDPVIVPLGEFPPVE